MSAHGRVGDDFTLLVDGCDDDDLAPINAFLAEIRSGLIGGCAKPSNRFCDVDLARFDRIAYPL